MKKIMLIILLMLMPGCFWPFKSDPLVKHPDAPMLIIEGSGKVRVAVYYKDLNKMVEYGWVDLDDLDGWSLKKFDWEKFIKKKEGN